LLILACESWDRGQAARIALAEHGTVYLDRFNQPRTRQYTEGHFAGRAIDPEDPPRYEVQAAYLARLGLLSPAERMALPTDALEDEVVLPATDDQVDTP